MRGENAGSATMPDGGAMIKHGRFCGSIPGCGTSRTIDQPGAAYGPTERSYRTGAATAPFAASLAQAWV